MKSFQESLYDLPVFPAFLHIPNPRQIMIGVCYKVCQDDGLAFSEVTQTEKYHSSILAVPSYLMFYPAWYVARQIIQIILHPCGRPRIAWDDLPQYAKKAWEEDPTPRPLRPILPA
jgi:hypothetical protein